MCWDKLCTSYPSFWTGMEWLSAWIFIGFPCFWGTSNLVLFIPEYTGSRLFTDLGSEIDFLSALNQIQNSRFFLHFLFLSRLSLIHLWELYKPLLWQMKQTRSRMKTMPVTKIVTANGSGRGSMERIVRKWQNFWQNSFAIFYAFKLGMSKILLQFTCMRKEEEKFYFFKFTVLLSLSWS